MCIYIYTYIHTQEVIYIYIFTGSYIYIMFYTSLNDGFGKNPKLVVLCVYFIPNKCYLLKYTFS
jgi:hypothetical protein